MKKGTYRDDQQVPSFLCNVQVNPIRILESHTLKRLGLLTYKYCMQIMHDICR